MPSHLPAVLETSIGRKIKINSTWAFEVANEFLMWLTGLQLDTIVVLSCCRDSFVMV